MTDSHREDLVLGWDVGGTRSAAVVATREGKILDRDEWESAVRRGPEAMIADFLERSRRMLAEFPGILGAGVSIGGPLDASTGTILSPPHLPGWDNVPLKDILRGELSLPVTVEHDAAACLLAEHLWGAAAGCSHAAYLTCGTGCGAGVLIDGRILRGCDGQSPEVGHVRLSDDGPEVFGKRGCAESFCSGEGIALLGPYMFPDLFGEPTDARTLAELAAAGHEGARDVLAESARRTGQLCAMLADIFSPQVIVLGSLARYLGEGWSGEVRDAFEVEALEVNAGRTKIVPSALGENLQDLSPVAARVYEQSQGASGSTSQK